jgi:hypothetical protein
MINNKVKAYIINYIGINNVNVIYIQSTLDNSNFR